MLMTKKIRAMFTYGIQEFRSCLRNETFIICPLPHSLEKERNVHGMSLECTCLIGQRDREHRHGDTHHQITVAHQLLSAGAVYQERLRHRGDGK